jgi:hypothetical protein
VNRTDKNRLPELALNYIPKGYADVGKYLTMSMKSKEP